MNFWWVNHGATHAEEIRNGYIWSPKTQRNGRRMATYDTMPQTRPGDPILSYANAAIRAIGVVTEAGSEAAKPAYRVTEANAWADTGWGVGVDWTMLQTPIAPRDHWEALRPLLPSKYSPVHANATGAQNVYLARISAELFQAVVDRIKGSPAAQAVVERIESSMPATQEELDEDEERREVERINADPEITTALRMALLEARLGQGKFRRRVAAADPICRLTGTSDRRMLIASHIKPWCKSNDTERLDGANGLMLAPHADRLFDRFLVSFDDSGKVLVAGPKVASLMLQWGMNPSLQTAALTAQQIPYMQYHRGRMAQKTLTGEWD